MSDSRFHHIAPTEMRTVINPKTSTRDVALMMEATIRELRPKVNLDGTFASSHRGPHEPRRPVETHVIEPQPSKTYRLSAGDGTTSRTDYTVRPRSKTSVEGRRRPLSLVLPSSTSRPIVTSDYERSRTSRHPGYHTGDDSDRYLKPASSRRRAFSSSTRDGRVVPVKKDSSPHSERGEYLMTGGRTRRVYPVSKPDLKPQDIDINEAYSYTNLKEEFFGDSAKRDHRRENPSRRRRPVSLTGLEGYLPQTLRDSRHNAPPVATRGFDKIRKDDDHHSHFSGSETSRNSENPRRHATQRIPGALHQERDKPTYREDRHDSSRDSRGYRVVRADDNVVVVDDRSYSSSLESRHDATSHRALSDRKVGKSDSESAHMMHGALATAGLARGYSKERRDKHSDRDISPHRDRGKPRERRPAKDDTESETDESEPDESSRRRRYRSSRHPHRDPIELKPTGRHEPRHSERGREDAENQRQGRSPIVTQKESLEVRPRRNSEAPPPKGILKQPTEKFPEDPTAVREGVAPLKDSNMKGIPAGARWTKIHRRLVSPAALEGLERFEEREDHVIVLRVLTREEIQTYAVRTAEIRSRYYRDRRRERHRDDNREYGHSRHSTDSDDEYDDDDSDDDDDGKRPLSIEPPSDSKRSHAT
ncbi:hypothetical protein PRK78_001394 [Emydomyces testavorans]|uniref:DUF8035 domain-containing protein n=1 Tax=Emydomyces testavorans TaxID=2070801 RepID=A0AAF0DCG3_9EURO|nr:hypothetical protein PRK78_001394 [Emydomyces testavorans]